MTTLVVIDGNRDETRSQAAARRLREELAGRRISMSEVARRLGTTQQKLSRRMTGLKSWDLDELDDVCRAAGLSFTYVTTGIRELPAPNGPDGNGGSRLGESNSRPIHYESTGNRWNGKLSPGADVIPIRKAHPATPGETAPRRKAA